MTANMKKKLHGGNIYISLGGEISNNYIDTVTVLGLLFEKLG